MSSPNCLMTVFLLCSWNVARIIYSVHAVSATTLITPLAVLSTAGSFLFTDTDWFCLRPFSLLVSNPFHFFFHLSTIASPLVQNESSFFQFDLLWPFQQWVVTQHYVLAISSVGQSVNKSRLLSGLSIIVKTTDRSSCFRCVLLSCFCLWLLLCILSSLYHCVISTVWLH